MDEDYTSNRCPKCGEKFPESFNYCTVCSTGDGGPVELPSHSVLDSIRARVNTPSNQVADTSEER